MRTATTLALSLALGSLPIFTGCAAQRIGTAEQQDEFEREIRIALDKMVAADPGLRAWIDDSYGYAAFPEVGKGGAIVGGAYGQGMVYELGSAIGTSALSQASVGFQLGGQTFKEVIFFEDKTALDKFTTGRFEFSANASAVAVESGASSAADFYDGMAVFTMPNGGLMFEAAIGGQKFTYRPLAR